MPSLDEIKHRTTPVGKILGVIEYLEEQNGGGGEGGGSNPVTTADITDATAIGRQVLTATDAAAARSAIGAGTSSQNLTALTASEATMGTATTARAITAAVLAGAINERTKGKAQIAALAPIADPATADAAAVATLLNDVIAALKA